jgi:3-oxoacyl-[acyl-carrier protein] reductase
MATEDVKRALVTGSSSGIGLAIAQALLDQGWDVVGLDLAPARIVHPAFSSTDVNLCNTEATERAVRSAGGVQALIHAAGVLRVGPLGALSGEDSALMWQLHVDAVMRIANLVVPAMAQAGAGRVVLIGSRVARGMAGRSQYAATKATETAMLADPARTTVPPKLPPLGRLIQPREIAALVTFLLSPDAAAITGQEIQICGGASLAA